MSQEIVNLVLGLEPPTRRNYHITASVHVRDRHLLLTLAALADDEGKAVASLGELQALTLMQLGTLIGARSSLAAQAYFAREDKSSEYYLNIDTLRARQSGAELRLRVPIYNLADYGLPSVIIRRLVSYENILTVQDLDGRLEKWRNSPDYDGTGENLAHYLHINMLGKGKCEQIIAAVDSWNTDHNE